MTKTDAAPEWALEVVERLAPGEPMVPEESVLGLFKISLRTLFEWRQLGKVKSVRGGRGKRFYLHTEVARLLAWRAGH